MMVTRILKSGHSYYVRIGKAYMDRLSMTRGTHVTVELVQDGITIKPLIKNGKGAGYEKKPETEN